MGQKVSESTFQQTYCVTPLKLMRLLDTHLESYKTSSYDHLLTDMRHNSRPNNEL